MRGVDHQQSQMFSYLSPETRVRKDHPLRAIRSMVDEVLAQLSRRFDSMVRERGPRRRNNTRLRSNGDFTSKSFMRNLLQPA
jgi:hypothetical protein